MPYANRTKVPIDKTRLDIERLARTTRACLCWELIDERRV